MRYGFTMLLAILLSGCSRLNSGYEGLPAPHVYIPIEADRKAYEFVRSHRCGENHHPASSTWSTSTNTLRPAAAFNVYYCDSVDGLIFVEEHHD